MIGRRPVLLGSLAALASCGRPSESDGRVKVTFWYSYGGKNRQAVEALVARFNREQNAVFVEATFQGDYYEALAKLRTAIAANAAPTLSHVVGEVIPYLARAGVLEPLDGYPGISALDLVSSLSQRGSFSGADGEALVAVPFNRSTPIMYVNGRMLDRAGVSTPATWSELRAAARRLTQRGTSGVSVWGFESPISWWFWVALLGAAGGSLVDDRGEVTLGGEAGAKAVRFWQALVHDDATMRPPAGRDYDAWQAVMQDFLSERAAIIWSSTAFLRYVEENARFEVRAAPMPADVTRAVPTGGTFFVVLKGAPAPAKSAACQFLRWMVEPRQTTEWSSKTGYLPVSQRAIEELDRTGYLARRVNDRVALDQLSVVQPWPWSPELFRVEREIVDPLLEELVIERGDARASFTRALRERIAP